MADLGFPEGLWFRAVPPERESKAATSGPFEVVCDGVHIGSLMVEETDGKTRVVFTSEQAVKSVIEPAAKAMAGDASYNAITARNRQLADALERRTAEISAATAELKAFKQAAHVANERGTALIKAAQKEVGEWMARATDAEAALALSKMTIQTLMARVAEERESEGCNRAVSTDLAVLCPEVADLMHDAHRVMVENGLQRDLEHLLKPLWEARERFAMECRCSGVQRCGNCPDYSCGDNMQAASQRAHEKRGGK